MGASPHLLPPFGVRSCEVVRIHPALWQCPSPLGFLTTDWFLPTPRPPLLASGRRSWACCSMRWSRLPESRQRQTGKPWLTLEGEQNLNLSSSVVGFQPLNHNKQKCRMLPNNNHEVHLKLQTCRENKFTIQTGLETSNFKQLTIGHLKQLAVKLQQTRPLPPKLASSQV